MASTTNLSFYGNTGVLRATSFVRDLTGSGDTRTVNVIVSVFSVDGSGSRNGSYAVGCDESGTDTGNVMCSISGTKLDIFNETFEVTVDSNNTAAINLAFTAQVYADAATTYTLNGSITQLYLDKEIGGGSSGSTGSKDTAFLNIVEGPGTRLNVIRSWSDESEWGYDVVLTGCAVVYWEKDRFEITAEALDGYDLDYFSFNGDSIGFKIEPINNVGYTTDGEKRFKLLSNTETTITTSARPWTYTLTITESKGVTVTVTNLSTGEVLTSGATLSHNDDLEIVFTAHEGYEILTRSINGDLITEDVLYKVSGNLTIEATAEKKKPVGAVYIDNGTALVPYYIFRDNGESWDQCIPYIDNGSGWDLCS